MDEERFEEVIEFLRDKIEQMIDAEAMKGVIGISVYGPDGSSAAPPGDLTLDFSDTDTCEATVTASLTELIDRYVKSYDDDDDEARADLGQRLAALGEHFLAQAKRLRVG